MYNRGQWQMPNEQDAQFYFEPHYESGQQYFRGRGRGMVQRGRSTNGRKTGGSRNFRGRGRGPPKDNTIGKGMSGIQVPKQDGEPTSTPPKPQHLSKTESEDKNDPLYRESVLPDPSEELRRRAADEYVQSGADGLTTTIDVLYNYAKIKPGFSKRISPSTLAYYCACITWARMLRSHELNSRELNYEEQVYCTQIENAKLNPPSILCDFISGFGNTTMPCGRDLRFRLLPRNYEDAGQYVGYFGRVSPENHFMYKSYPCLAVFAQRIIEDMNKTANHAMNPNWNLPEEIRPAEVGAEAPTENMLGWKPAQVLSPQMIEFLATSGVRLNVAEPFPVDNAVLMLNVHLLQAIQVELTNLEYVETKPLPTDYLIGSRAQVPFLEFQTNQNVEIQSDAYLCSPLKLSGSLSFMGSAFMYRIKHRIPEIPIRRPQVIPQPNWSVYNFIENAMPTEYVDRVNELRVREFPQLQDDWYRTVDLNLEARVRRIYESNRPKEK